MPGDNHRIDMLTFGGIKGSAWGRCGAGVFKLHQVPLDCAAKLGAGNHFLAKIAAFVEIYRSSIVQGQHLG